MALRLVGAGLGRTGTNSLKLALERLLGEPCYHMIEVFQHQEHVETWTRACAGEPVDWDALLAGYAAAVDWPAAACWKELAAAYPDAPILLSTRTDADEWYRSASQTIFVGIPQAPPGPWKDMVDSMLGNRFTLDLSPESAKPAYDRWNAQVRAEADPGRLVEWQPSDGWGPLCRALGVDEPDEPFPHTNTTEQFRARAGWD